MANKKTKRDFYGELKELVRGNAELENFIDHEIELLNNKANKRGTSKVNEENLQIMELIVNELAILEVPVTISDLMEQSENIANYVTKEGKHLSNQKISALMTKLIDNKKVDKKIEKKKSYFMIKTNAEEEIEE